MSDEKNEILNKLLEYFKESNINNFGYEQDKLISYEEAQILLERITILQNGFKSTVEELCEITEKYEKLQKENERLKEIVENLTTMTVCGDKKQIKNTAQYKLEIYKSRIDKAIEYNKTHYVIDDPIKFKNDMNDILNGGDDNE